MSKTVLYWILGVAAVGGIAIYATGNSGSAGSPADTANNSGQPSETQPATGTMKDLLARGASECSVSSSEANSETKGIVFVGGGKIRGDFTTAIKSPAMTVASHMISDGTDVYTWTSAMPQGVKVPVAKADAPQESGQQNMYSSQVNYTCKGWTVDPSRFMVPPDIIFLDAGAASGGSKSAPGGTPGAGASGMMSCATCDLIPDASAKSQCKAALRCK